MSQEPSSTQPTQDERTMATLAQILQLVASWIAPLIILIVRRESRFVSFHALQALLLQILYMVVAILLIVVFVAFGILGAAAQSQIARDGPPVAFFLMIPLIWLTMLVAWVVNLVLAIVYGIKAGRGEWAEYPLLGGLARRILKLGPGGVPLPAHF